jgi:hypothetical protein
MPQFLSSCVGVGQVEPFCKFRLRLDSCPDSTEKECLVFLVTDRRWLQVGDGETLITVDTSWQQPGTSER